MALFERVFRWLYAAWFIFWGGSSLTMRLWGVGVAPPASQGEAKALMDTVNASFMGPIAGVCFVIGGLMLLRARTAPLGIAILAPFVTYILFFHLLLTGNAGWGIAWFAGWAALAWWHRGAFRALVGLDRQPA
ncbi:hypothetical protein [Sphingomicrobium nitratireducens]|uniref:hypothetical protein n=1 Tax=Sphingomicrobium nitratireducens TaxID=2964666 RepID=UPI00223FA548|nr:hypothetical protein [Sphingomicrobium nitratireducens]